MGQGPQWPQINLSGKKKFAVLPCVRIKTNLLKLNRFYITTSAGVQRMKR